MRLELRPNKVVGAGGGTWYKTQRARWFLDKVRAARVIYSGAMLDGNSTEARIWTEAVIGDE